MELFFFSIPFVVLLPLLLVFGLSIISLKFLAGKHKSSAKLPPGKTGWPVIGETLEFIKLRRKGIPEKFNQDRMKMFSSEIFRTGLFGETLAVFCGPAGNKFLFSNENKYVQGWCPKSVQKVFPVSEQTSTREEGKLLRRLYPKYLNLETLQTYIGTMDAMAKQHFEDNWDNKEEVIVYPLVLNYTFSLACRLFISVDDPSRVQKLLKPFHMLKAGLISVLLKLRFIFGESFHQLLRKGRLIYWRKKRLLHKISCLICSTITYIDDNSGQFMNELDIATKIIGLIFGGHDTATSTITLNAKYLGELPEIYEEQMEIGESKEAGEMLNWGDIQKMKYSWNMAKEVVRLAPPAQGTFREAITDFTFAGY